MRKKILLLHRWLGLLTGLVVAIVAATGCLYAFADEIETWGMNSVAHRASDPLLAPEALALSARRQLAEKGDSAVKIIGITYRAKGLTALLTYMDSQNGSHTILIDPYHGHIVGSLRGETFFAWVLKGHRSLWLPYGIGHLMVGWATAIFVLVLISGLVLWSPRRWNKTLVRSRLTVKWKAGENRRMYDLHNTLGFYISLLAVIIAFIGLTWSFPPLAKGYYRMLTNRELLEWNLPVSDTTQRTGQSNVAQKLWKRHCAMIPQKGKGSLRFDFPQDKSGAYLVVFNPDNHRYGRQVYWFYDQYNGNLLNGGGSYAIPPSDMKMGDKIFRASYDIHSGSILGYTGRVVIFLVSLVAATLPFTGFLLWRKKRKRRP